MTLSLAGYDSISTDGSGRVLITRIGNTNGFALICRSGKPISGDGDWYSHPTEMSTTDSNRITTFSGGWSSNRATNSEGHRLVRLRRDSATAEEGVFTCHFPGDDNTPRYLGVYYPSE